MKITIPSESMKEKESFYLVFPMEEKANENDLKKEPITIGSKE